jgi:hypothetical protein
MAGHRKQRHTPRRAEPGKRARARLAAAATAEEQLAAAFDVFRSAIRRADTRRRSQVMREAAQFLARLAGTVSEAPR